MLETHPNLSHPADSTSLWRYVDLAKLIALLEDRALWFARLDSLDDPYEGLPTRILIDDMWSIPEELPTAERLRRKHVAGHNTRVFQAVRERLYVSCWHASEVESAAMWSLYARQGDGIAIRTTFDRFKRSFTGATGVYAGLVKYVDFNTYRPASRNSLEWATLKRSSFAHESEFRAIVLGPDDSSGLNVEIDVRTLIGEVYVAPAAVQWYADLVRRLCARYGVEGHVRQSELLRHPAYLSPRLDVPESEQ